MTSFRNSNQSMSGRFQQFLLGTARQCWSFEK